LRIMGFLSGLFVANVQLYCGRAIAVGRAKFVSAGSLRVGDALERYGESRRRAIVQLSPLPRVVGGRGTGM